MCHPLLSYRVLSPIRLPSSQSTPFSTHLLSQHCRLFSHLLSPPLLSLISSLIVSSPILSPIFSSRSPIFFFSLHSLPLLTLSPPFLSSTVLPRTIHYPPFPYPALSSPPLPLPSHPQQTGSYSTMLQHFSQFPLQEYAWNLADEILLGNMNVDTSSNNR